MRRFGLTGFPLSHSFSAKYFSEKFTTLKISDCEYLNFPLKDAAEIRSLFVNDPLLCGLNVTIPHKKAVIAILDVIDPKAFSVGAVNVIKAYQNDGNVILKGFNTDVYGFRESLPIDITERAGVALILGSGGAAGAIISVLRILGFEILVVSRKGEPGSILYKDLPASVIRRASLIVNATPLGMYPDTDISPDINYDHLADSAFLYDLVYNPATTKFMSEGISRGCRAMNGLKMLELQADKAWEIWNNDSA